MSATAPAQQSEVATGVPTSITIAQAILESHWGEHHVGPANNYFGIKAQQRNGRIVYGDIANGYVTKSTKEHLKKSNIDIETKDYFRSYGDMAASFRDHGSFLQNNSRHKAALDAYANDGDAEKFAHELQKETYATDPHYADLLILIMRNNGLYKFNLKKQEAILK